MTDEIKDVLEKLEYFEPEDLIECAMYRECLGKLQGLLALYEKEKQKNKLLKTYKGNLPENVEMICLCKDDFERNISSDYISKDKIREKIEEWLEFDKKYKTYTSDGRENFSIEYFKAKTLQELLEESE